MNEVEVRGGLECSVKRETEHRFKFTSIGRLLLVLKRSNRSKVQNRTVRKDSNYFLI